MQPCCSCPHPGWHLLVLAMLPAARGASVLCREFCACSRQVCSGGMGPGAAGEGLAMAGTRTAIRAEMPAHAGGRIMAEWLKAPEELERTVVPRDGHR